MGSCTTLRLPMRYAGPSRMSARGRRGTRREGALGERPRTIDYFVWLRALGAVAIVVLHAFVSLHVAIGSDALGPVRLGVEEGLSIVLTRWAVPVFFMMSGALMLDPGREMGWRKLLGHVWRLGFVLLTFGYAFCLIEVWVARGALDTDGVWKATTNLLRQRSWDHMWFVYELLGYYLMTPFLRPWVAQASREEYGRVALGICLLFFCTKFASAFFPFNIYYGVSVPYCLAYYLIGPYVHRYLELDRRWVALGVASVVATIVCRVAFGWVWAAEPIRGLVAPYAIMLMLAAKRWLDVPAGGHRAVAVLADYSFGIYLIHPLFQHLLVRLTDVVSWPAALAALTLTAVPLVLSVAFVWVARLIPGVRDKL